MQISRNIRRRQRDLAALRRRKASLNALHAEIEITYGPREVYWQKDPATEKQVLDQMRLYDPKRYAIIERDYKRQGRPIP